jgi:hypothetical protein
MRGKPFIIVLTMILSALILVTSALNVIHWLSMFPLINTGEISILGFVFMGQRILFLVLLSAATFFAAWKGRRWGFPVSVCFAVVLILIVVAGILVPNPHPTFVIHEGAEATGAWFGRMLTAVGVPVYAGFVAFGGKARAYFSQGEVNVRT